MIVHDKLTYKDMEKLSNSISSCKVKCDCGHTVILAKQDVALCSWCGKYVFKNKEIEFKFRLKEQMIKKEREN